MYAGTHYNNTNPISGETALDSHEQYHIHFLMNNDKKFTELHKKLPIILMKKFNTHKLMLEWLPLLHQHGFLIAAADVINCPQEHEATRPPCTMVTLTIQEHVNDSL